MMKPSAFTQLIRISEAHVIARRFFVTNGFDGVLTINGILMGFYLSPTIETVIALKACLGASIALFMSGLTSAYVSESAERKKELRELESAMVTDLSQSQHGVAATVVPVVVALVNGLSPLIFALLGTLPLWLDYFGVVLPINPYLMAIGSSLIILFFLGIYLSRLSNTFWLSSGLKTLFIGIITLVIVKLVNF